MGNVRALELFLLPLAILSVSIIMQAGALGSGGYQGGIDCQANPGSCNAQAGITPPMISCNPNFFNFPCNITKAINVGGTNYCQQATGNPLFNSWGPSPPSPAYCQGNSVLLPAGKTVTVTNVPGPGNLFGVVVQTLGPDGFIAVLSALGGVVVLSALSIFSNGENATGTRVFFFVLMGIALWGMMAATEGSLSPGGGFFSFLDKMVPFLGTSFFVILTLGYVGGIMALISGIGGA